MSVARFNFSHGSHEYHQGTLDTLRQAMANTRLMCGVLLDTKGPEIRTGMLKGGKPVLMETGREVTIHTDYTLHGDEYNIAMSYKKLPEDVKPGAEVRGDRGTKQHSHRKRERAGFFFSFSLFFFDEGGPQKYHHACPRLRFFFLFGDHLFFLCSSRVSSPTFPVFMLPQTETKS